MHDALTTIQLLVAPVVLISANGLMCLALYNRLAAIVTRARAFHKERFETLNHLSSMPLDQQTSLAARQLRQRVVMLNRQDRMVLRRARLIRAALLELLASVLCMLLCSTALGLTLVLPDIHALPLVMFILGVLMMIGGIVMAMVELTWALDPVSTEREALLDRTDDLSLAA